jgi:Helix-turn-helix domain
MIDDEYLTYGELARLLRMSEQGLRNRFSKGESMPDSIKPGLRRLFSRSSVEKWLEESHPKKAEVPDLT